MATLDVEATITEFIRAHGREPLGFEMQEIEKITLAVANTLPLAVYMDFWRKHNA